MRERGLKFHVTRNLVLDVAGRSREGAWIEILQSLHLCSSSFSRSREGAWIEIN